MNEESPEFPAKEAFINSALLQRFPFWAGAVVALGGLMIICSWYAHWQTLLQFIPKTAPMQYNTALCFVMLGTGLWLLNIRREQATAWLGGATALLAGLTLLEYVASRDFGIDQIFFQPYINDATAFPGRMSPLAAVCFMLLGGGLIFAGKRESSSRRLAVAGLLACAVGVISVVVLCGYLFGIETAYGWGAYSRMAVNTAMEFFIGSCGLLVWTWRTAGREADTFLRWLPAAGSVTLITMVAIIALVNTSELNQAIFWRQHTIGVILSSQSFLDNILDLQRGLRGYVLLGDANSLASYKSGIASAPARWSELAVLTQDNPSQQKRLQELQTALSNLLAYDRRVLSVYADQGFAGVSRLDATGEGRLHVGQTRDILGAFSSEEKRLLADRSGTEQADYEKNARLLVFGCGSASLLMLAGNFLASRQIRLRRRAEAKLLTALTLQNAILSSANYAIVATNRRGIIKAFNSAAETMLGYPAGEVVDKATPQIWVEGGVDRPVADNFRIETWLAAIGLNGLGEGETQFVRKNGERFPVLVSATMLANARGEMTGFLTVFGDISERKAREAERDKLISDLQEALAQVKTLSGLIPICGWCKNVRSDKGFWQTVEQYVHAHTDATFTHGICPQCTEKVMAEERKRRGVTAKP